MSHTPPPDILPFRPTGAAAVTPGIAPLAVGPWVAFDMAATPSGAVLIEDADGNILGWATDVAGHTSETVPPEGRAPAAIAVHARVMAAAHALLTLARQLAAIEPLLTARLMIHGTPDVALVALAAQARAIEARVFADAPGR